MRTMSKKEKLIDGAMIIAFTMLLSIVAILSVLTF
jgi:hypothetical protein